MALTRSGRYSERGFTLTEILITVILMSMVLLAAGAVYTSGFRMLRSPSSSADVTQQPEIGLEEIARRVKVANQATLTETGNTQLNLRIDYDVCANTRSPLTPAVTGDDNYWHYRIRNGQLLFLCDNSAVTTLDSVGTPPNTYAILSNVNVGASSFSVTNPTFPITPATAGSATVVNIRITTTSPVKTVETEVALGAAPKR